jgi:hypothetical protein
MIKGVRRLMFNRQTLKFSPLAVLSIVIYKKMKFEMTKDEVFEERLKLIYPHYNGYSEDDSGKHCKIVSEN